MASLPTIALDVDEVLAQFLPAINEWYNAKFGTSYQISDYESYSFGEVWKVNYDESIDVVYDFFKSRAFEELKVVPGSREAVHWLSEHFQLAVVTSRQTVIEEATMRWLETHFGRGTFTAVLFGNIWIPRRSDSDVGGDAPHSTPSLPSVKRTKKEMCEQIQAQVLVDDQPKYIHDVKDVVQLPILFNFKKQYRWIKEGGGGGGASAAGELHEIVAHDWSEVLQYVRVHFGLAQDAAYERVIAQIRSLK